MIQLFLFITVFLNFILTLDSGRRLGAMTEAYFELWGRLPGLAEKQLAIEVYEKYFDGGKHRNGIFYRLGKKLRGK